MWGHICYSATYCTPTLYHIVLVLKTSPMQRLTTSQKDTVAILVYNIHIIHMQYMSTSWATHLPPLQNTTPYMLLERQPTVISRDWKTTFMVN